MEPTRMLGSSTAETLNVELLLREGRPISVLFEGDCGSVLGYALPVASESGFIQGTIVYIRNLTPDELTTSMRTASGILNATRGSEGRQPPMPPVASLLSHAPTPRATEWITTAASSADAVIMSLRNLESLGEETELPPTEGEEA